MKIKCPECKSELEVDSFGDFVSCPSCSEEFNVEESHKVKSLIEHFHPFEESKPYIAPVAPEIQRISKTSDEPIYVIVTDFKMEFISMVTFMVKWVIASIPALMILGFLLFLMLLLMQSFTGK